MALENTLIENFNGTLPEDVKSNSDCITLYDSEISDCISEMVKVDKTINVEKLKETYKNMFSSEIEDYASVSKNTFIVELLIDIMSMNLNQIVLLQKYIMYIIKIIILLMNMLILLL